MSVCERDLVGARKIVNAWKLDGGHWYDVSLPCRRDTLRRQKFFDLFIRGSGARERKRMNDTAKLRTKEVFGITTP